MARTPKAEQRERGLYQNGAKWWLRVRSPLTGAISPRSTGTTDLALANRIARMVRDFSENRTQWEWLDAAQKGDLPLDRLYDNHAAGTLNALRKATAEAAVTRSDMDLRPFVDRWAREELPFLVGAQKITAHTARNYERQVRALIPADAPFPRSGFTEDAVKTALAQLTDPRTGALLSGSTQRRHVAAWQRFYKWAKKAVPLTVNPFVDADEWMPEENDARSVSWDFPDVLRVLDAMHGEAKVAMTLVFGAGVELGALLAMKGRDIGKNDDERAITVRGTKNGWRDRTAFVDEWAWPVIAAHAATKRPNAPLWSELDTDPENGGNDLREAFYEAQVACGLIDEPPRRAKAGNRLWGSVNPHRIHDARHTYCVIRLLGLDGAKREDLKYVAGQLGHRDETMVMKVYSKMKIAERLRRIELREAREAGRQDAARAAA